MTLFRRRTPAWQETLVSGLLAAGVGATTFYLTRLLLGRDRLPWRPETALELDARGARPELEPADASLTPGAEGG